VSIGRRAVVVQPRWARAGAADERREPLGDEDALARPPAPGAGWLRRQNVSATITVLRRLVPRMQIALESFI